MLIYAIELFDWNLICSFMIFISYSPAISFNSCKSDEKLSILATKMDGSLAIFLILILVLVSSSSSSCASKELVIGTDLLGCYLVIFGCFRGVDISALFLFLFLPLTSFYETSIFLGCPSPMSLAPFTRHRSVIDSSSESDFFLILA